VKTKRPEDFSAMKDRTEQEPPDPLADRMDERADRSASPECREGGKHERVQPRPGCDPVRHLIDPATSRGD
jgi:hypothetical protein